MTDPFFDPTYDHFLTDCASKCRCCSCCWQVPCGGCTAGGVCDAMPCSTDDDAFDAGDFYADLEDGDHG